MVSNAGNKPEILGLEALRGIGSLIVLIHHVNWANPFFSVRLIRNAWPMADMFFVLSGFVIALNYASRINTPKDTYRFLWLRFWRVYPLHFFVLLFFVGIELLKLAIVLAFGPAMGKPFYEGWYSDFFGHLLMMQGFWAAGQLNAPAWSIGAEWLMYVAGAFLMLATRHWRLASVAICVAMGVWLLSSTQSFMVRAAYDYFFGFIAFAVYERIKPHVDRHSLGATAWGVLAGLGLILFFGTVIAIPSHLDDPRIPYFGWQSPMVIPIAPAAAIMTVIIALSPRVSMVRVLDARPFVWLGTLAYSIYMVHWALLWFVRQFLLFYLRWQGTLTPEMKTMDFLPISPVLGAGLTIGVMLVTLAISRWTYAHIEAPLRLWGRRSVDLLPDMLKRTRDRIAIRFS